MKNINLIVIVAAMLIMSACSNYEYTPYPPTSFTCPDGTVLTCPAGEQMAENENMSSEINEQLTGEIIQEIPESTEEEVSEEPAAEETTGEEADIVVREGELVQLNPKVKDADGDEISLTFSAPLNDRGEWQTAPGDAGLHTVTVTASDGKSSVKKEIRILVLSGNAAPEIKINDVLSFKGGDKIELKPEITDADNDNVTVTFSGWMDGNVYQTTNDDAGDHTVTITATDGKTTVTKNVKIVVTKANRKPVLKLVNVEQGLIRAQEGDKIRINAEATDPDGDEVTISYSLPFDQTGVWQTKEGDNGQYEVEVTADDGIDKTVAEVLVEVSPVNKPPVFEEINDFVITVGENVQDYILPTVIDPEGKDITITYSGWLDDIDHVVTEDEAGDHMLKITYSDGVNKVSQDVKITVNSPPVFTI